MVSTVKDCKGRNLEQAAGLGGGPFVDSVQHAHQYSVGSVPDSTNKATQELRDAPQGSQYKSRENRGAEWGITPRKKGENS
ncbi:hypothetical protein ABIE18_004281 [Arthrobacter sp. 2762]